MASSTVELSLTSTFPYLFVMCVIADILDALDGV